MGIVVRADSPWKTFEDLIDAGKKEPDKYNYGTSGVGGTGQLMMIEVEQATGAKFTHVPYKGGAEWMQALMGGEIQFICRRRAMGAVRRRRQVPHPGLRHRAAHPALQGRPDHDRARRQGRGPEPLRPARPQGHAAEDRRCHLPGFQGGLGRPKVTRVSRQFIQVPWDKNPAEFRAFAEKYYVDVKPLLIKAGLAKS